MTGCCCLPCGSSKELTGPVTLNVGGNRFTTSWRTLAGCPKLRQDVLAAPASDGAYFLDRDGRFFSEILNYLRDGAELYQPPTEVDARRILQREATYFELSDLAKSVQEIYSGAPIPSNENERMERLDGLNIMHTDEHEQHFDAITRIIAAVLDVPIALVSLVGDDHQWFKSRVGLEANSTPRNTSFCAFTFTPEVPSCAMMCLIENAKLEPRVKDNPLVLGPPYISFYAGCPLVTSDGMRLGALCAIDRQPRSISPLQAQMLVNFGQICVSEIERGQLMCLEEDEEEELGLEAIPSAIDFAAGPLRTERMREALTESLCLVQVRTDSFDWRILYANQVWSNFSGWRIIPPDRFPSKVVAEQLNLNGNMAFERSVSGKRLEKELGFLSWLQLTEKTPDQLLQDIKFNWSQPEPIAFALKGLAATGSSHGGRVERKPVVCRFMPAELPIDAAAAAIRPLPQREANAPVGQLHPSVVGRFYFVTTVQSTERPPERPGNGSLHTEDSSLLGGPDGRQLSGSSERKRRGNTMDAVAAIKPPRSPFDDVRLLRLVGQGSFGKVYYGFWTGSPVAVKIIETRSSEQKARSKPAFEAVLSASVAHPNLVQTFMSSSRTKPAAGDMPEEAETFETWMVQEWCDRGTLGAHCSRPRSDPSSIPEVIDITIDIACAGSYLHSRGIIHGDLTANNVLIKTQVSRKGYVCKVCDFGLARVLEGDTMDIMTTQLGTVTHMPPELFAVGEEVRLTSMADIYAAGILTWQAVKGEVPFKGLSEPQVVVQIVKGKRLRMPDGTMPEIVEAFDRCTAPDPEDRPTFDELLQILNSILALLSRGSC